MKTIQTERLFIKTFAYDSSFCKNLDVAEVKLKTLNRLFNLEVLAMPLICTPIANQRNLTVSRSYLHSRHLKLADLFDNKKHVYWNAKRNRLLPLVIPGRNNKRQRKWAFSSKFSSSVDCQWILLDFRFPRANKKRIF